MNDGQAAARRATGLLRHGLLAHLICSWVGVFIWMKLERHLAVGLPNGRLIESVGGDSENLVVVLGTLNRLHHRRHAAADGRCSVRVERTRRAGCCHAPSRRPARPSLTAPRSHRASVDDAPPPTAPFEPPPTTRLWLRSKTPMAAVVGAEHRPCVGHVGSSSFEAVGYRGDASNTQSLHKDKVGCAHIVLAGVKCEDVRTSNMDARHIAGLRCASLCDVLLVERGTAQEMVASLVQSFEQI